MTAPTPVLEIDAVSYRYGDRVALNNVSLKVMRGDVFALLGPNGAGKSTLIRTLCGRLRPTTGTVLVYGGNPARSRAARGCIGLVPQDIALYPYMTVAENLSVFGRLAGIRGARLVTMVDQAVTATGLEDRVDQRVETLSGGYKRRANIASALLHAPKLLVLDEPTVGVDLDARNSINAVLRSLSESGMSVLITTHDLDQAASVASSVGIIVQGQVIETGAPDDLVAQRFGDDQELVLLLAEPAHPGVAALLTDRGFKSLEEGRHWRGRLPSEGPGVDTLTSELVSAGARLRETRVRQPGLDSLYADLTGESEVA
ncbi:ABC transporter, ATP-binding protein [Candidatus Phaeomarinobacter ectocarpi]|uniref:ABC transporter, ATP-binding protein n=1 Tax=Candidatus Phaeomarinibacter ectocarpi TaxID=1458461 RepID=X5M831_9HYPH|nr:ABC transporter ATP-binding protein [Candidatus Phaeomarinobacter ectocarpi]CDO59413.1 ABC transporter, ATP-binding protein [Candidatus Phaeomarinobacter ectocarpi]